MKEFSKDSSIISDTIDVLRFPLAIAVIFIHMNPIVVNLTEADFSIFSHKGLFNLVGITFSHVLTHIAVPCFFLISGYLFFLNIKKWSWIQYKNKLKSRITTLFIPYLLWNITPWILMLIALFTKGIFIDNSFDMLYEFISNYNLNILYNCYHWGETKINWFGNNLLSTGPFDLPLCFLRDLIFMVILTPIIYFLLKKINIWYIAILFIAYISRVWTLIPGFSITACIFFSLGAFFSLNNINFLSIVRKYRYLIISLSIILLLINIIYDGTNTVIGQNVYPFFIIFTVFAAFYITSRIVEKYNIRANKFLVSSCFFIYAFHAFILGYPLNFCKKILGYILPEMSIIRYLITPFITAILCILIMQIGKKVLPGVTKWYTGNR